MPVENVAGVIRSPPNRATVISCVEEHYQDSPSLPPSFSSHFGPVSDNKGKLLQECREIASVGTERREKKRKRAKKRRRRRGEADQVKWKIACRLRNKRWSSHYQHGRKNWLNLKRGENGFGTEELKFWEVEFSPCNDGTQRDLAR
ncbi:hypothetical protein CDAR_608171 [Caerostris darwini]|uniref:Uncharacterized protein n=1 Tax=Caerostris darwini TaxID=1538125 RepID=A0AAV4PYS1_9ARAC|nr:hypothetical protein CDAR_608171 [Caerostris darwini]